MFTCIHMYVYIHCIVLLKHTVCSPGPCGQRPQVLQRCEEQEQHQWGLVVGWQECRTSRTWPSCYQGRRHSDAAGWFRWGQGSQHYVTMLPQSWRHKWTLHSRYHCWHALGEIGQRWCLPDTCTADSGKIQILPIHLLGHPGNNPFIRCQKKFMAMHPKTTFSNINTYLLRAKRLDWFCTKPVHKIKSIH